MRVYLSTLLAVTLLAAPIFGASWKVIYTPVQDNFLGVCFVNTDTGFVCTGEGRCAFTYNAGQSWFVTDVAPGIALEDVCFLNSDTGLVCGRKGTLMRTIDGGHSWKDVSPVEDPAHLHDVEMFDSRVGLAVGWGMQDSLPYESIVLRTTDGGATWDRETPVGMGPFEIFYRPGGRLCLLTFGRAYFSVDKGLTWHGVPTVEGSPGRTISFAGKSGIIGGPGGTCAHTADSGRTWIPVPQNEGSFFISSQMVDDSIGYLAGHPSVLLRTADGGKTWRSEQMPSLFDVYDMFLTEKHLWAVGAKSGILRLSVER